MIEVLDTDITKLKVDTIASRESADLEPGKTLGRFVVHGHFLDASPRWPGLEEPQNPLHRPRGTFERRLKRAI